MNWFRSVGGSSDCHKEKREIYRVGKY